MFNISIWPFRILNFTVCSCNWSSSSTFLILLIENALVSCMKQLFQFKFWIDILCKNCFRLRGTFSVLWVTLERLLILTCIILFWTSTPAAFLSKSKVISILSKSVKLVVSSTKLISKSHHLHSRIRRPLFARWQPDLRFDFWPREHQVYIPILIIKQILTCFGHWINSYTSCHAHCAPPKLWQWQAGRHLR